MCKGDNVSYNVLLFCLEIPVDLLNSFLFYFLAEFVKSTTFYTLLLLFQSVEIFELRFDAKIAIQICQLLEIAAIVFKKQWI